ncbi:hypothetical protein E5K00_08100 [Hymenobacter aquaticus]|uniref:Lipoprotein n=1 Tax=Hymenobacter aquaticus TaxID=1867101 RepID=A0A4Z0Q6S1_9BACT|nr:hypothetical protein [Hymenobacter aquaticus]TGE25146.1 hypothetical protein E5K00_08100 [Hymenobacter aquaticus]
MRKLTTTLSMLSVAATLLLGACESQSVQPKPASYSSSIPQNRKVIHYAEWDEWGHASANCGGWGLCNYWDCWFCEVPRTATHKGTVEYDDLTNEGNLIIALNPTQEIEAKAIAEKWVFYVDKDIDNTNSRLHAGKYAFDPSVGESGGYIIPITIKK